MESEDLTVVDFTLHFKGLPKEMDAKNAEECFKEFFEKNCLPDRKTPVHEIFMFFDLDEIDKEKDI